MRAIRSCPANVRVQRRRPGDRAGVRCNPGLDAVSTLWRGRLLGPMPHCHDPDNVAVLTIEEPVRSHDDLPVRQLWKLRDPTA